ncbi:hypothetical protein QBC46DRAFT_161906 [Diplogelasinospora grovesii]|uniref:Uncharacterized protein n=1 Tax=Diplogelasinospora grovesii TaxID=303347 RepID=A0AAN6N3W0_9PEZI|nr:hypothetical protein QBC46DRAFT_161906 [Diplogelasinospora grovesii]
MASSRRNVEAGVGQQGPVVFGFTCVGKTGLLRRGAPDGYEVVDLDSADWKDGWPDGYVEAIARAASRRAVVLVSTHAEVREAVLRRGLWSALVYPLRELRAEWLQRLRDRQATCPGGPDLASVFGANWDLWLEQLESQRGVMHCVLPSGSFITECVADVLQVFEEQCARGSDDGRAEHAGERVCTGGRDA